MTRWKTEQHQYLDSGACLERQNSKAVVRRMPGKDVVPDYDQQYMRGVWNLDDEVEVRPIRIVFEVGTLRSN